MTRKKRGRIFREKRQDTASGRREAREVLSPTEQIAVLDKRLGAGVGAAKERARLQQTDNGRKNRKGKK